MYICRYLTYLTLVRSIIRDYGVRYILGCLVFIFVLDETRLPRLDYYLMLYLLRNVRKEEGFGPSGGGFGLLTVDDEKKITNGRVIHPQ